MIEEIIISGRNNPEIDPTLHIWGWEIPFYLFIGGLVAGILFFSALYTIRDKSSEYPTVVMIAPMFTPFFLGIGLFALFLDLSHKLYFWQLYTNIRWESPMSWGAWTLMVVTPLSIIWSASWVQDVFPNWDWKYNWIKDILTKFIEIRKQVAWLIIFLSIILGMYTGILLSAFNARPFWNTAILGPLFLTSGLSAGAAFIILLSKSKKEKHLFIKIDFMLIITELFLIVHMFMGFLAGTKVHIEAANLFLGGPFTVQFWVFVVGLGLIVPIFLEILELKNKPIPAYLSAILVLYGSIMLRFIVVEAGQASRWLY
ncbi:MAG: polysulfide reductase NrfD [Candidatus Marinimicrobia bacterium]|jgi:formate-dependent nitrite reductase membrane component NrfD|nr:polysulfide reductase NrfD [Candidatus Neomarinimicrobiota bacterium]MBT3502199.1 polysulfide reductase NrfD [Candidatus Neomarinimicrobiota bacterium]MBT3839622.1 polysulfide reductase NrfD [Candidatus Neomarinimicrobiota bacterium]MBT3998350.1 polysulfide reductase NrfD [Candidatus Neomarinimicrobiota bacterium]MBT4282447.1 polysulfide reductase NrfD [Candidatus Neomarinimicrobiota bacterium]